VDLVDYDLAAGGNIRVGVTVPNPVSEQYPRGKLNPGQTVQVVIE
jgi:hypothetical protein